MLNKSQNKKHTHTLQTTDVTVTYLALRRSACTSTAKAKRNLNIRNMSKKLNIFVVDISPSSLFSFKSNSPLECCPEILEPMTEDISYFMYISASPVSVLLYVGMICGTLYFGLFI